MGEVDSVPLVAKAAIEAPPSDAIATGVRQLLIGEDPREIERLWDKMYRGTIYFGRFGPAIHAISGVDMALWDLNGKSANRPISSLLGGAFQHRPPAYANSLMPKTPREAGRLAEEYARQSYRAMKFGWGPIGRDPRLDAELVRCIRSAVGDDIKIMIDASLAWDLKGVLRMIEVYEKYDVFWLEEPLRPDDLDGYRVLAESTSTSIAAGEQESGRKVFARLLDEAHVDILQPDLGRCGGLTEGKRIAFMAHDRHKRLVPHAFKTGILVAASTHFAAAIPNGFMIEHTTSTSPLSRDLVTNPIAFSDGYVIVPTDRPGLGVDLDDAVLERYRVAA